MVAGAAPWDSRRGLNPRHRRWWLTSDLNTHTFAPAECAEAYDLATDQRGDTMGILFDWTTTGSS